MAAKSASDVATMLGRAVELGRELARLDNPDIRRFTRQAWERRTLELCNAASLEELAPIRARMEAKPRLWAHAALLAELTIRDRHHAPSLHAFDDVERHPVVAYALLAAGVTPEQASAVVGALVLGTAAPSWFGEAETGEEAAQAAVAIRAELERLDAGLFGTVRLADVAWQDGRPMLVVGGVWLPIPDIRRIASDIAEHAGRGRLPVAA
jgi:hypothetical protein